MSVVKELFVTTRSFVEFVGQPIPEDEEAREEYLKKINEELAKREPLIAQVDRENLTESEKALGAELVKLNEKLTERLAIISSQIQDDLKKIKIKKQTGHKYEHPYEGPTADGVFFDKRGV
ncbi:flagellar protein [Bacillus sp. FJAT-45037]|uniref:flagellar protein n=1 Tax=Bacillus sp. FJAT-45037 TaxID=2011007 RepID=UPI000C24730F|nr:flagellar protein [Bacillus sp. FJAT-45037]